MKLYLMRHCHAEEGGREDATRGLTDIGKLQAETMREFMKAADIEPEVIITTDFARALETAEIVQRKDAPIVTSKALEPDSTVEKAWKAIRKIAADASRVLVITHGPLIEPLLASVAFCIDPSQLHWYHGALAYVNTDESEFRWMVTPKLAAHIVGEDPKDVEAPLREALGAGLVAVSENLMVAHKRAVIDPRVSEMKRALKLRWKRQLARLIKQLPELKHDIAAGDARLVATMLSAAVPLSDVRFTKTYAAVRDAAYDAGAEHVHAQLGRPLKEARPKYIARTSRPEDNASRYEDQIDATTADQVNASISALDILSAAGIALILRRLFFGFSSVAAGLVSRAETAALDIVSGAYHDGGADTAAQVARDTGQEIEKHWDVESEACETCLENESEDWIPEDAPHSSGDFEPPAHPNCRCSESYRPAPP